MSVFLDSTDKYSSGGATSSADLTALTARVATLEVDQTVQDSLIEANATDTELAALTTIVNGNIDNTVTGIARQPDRSLLVTLEDNSTVPIAAAPDEQLDSSYGVTGILNNAVSYTFAQLWDDFDLKDTGVYQGSTKTLAGNIDNDGAQFYTFINNVLTTETANVPIPANTHWTVTRVQNAAKTPILIYDTDMSTATTRAFDMLSGNFDYEYVEGFSSDHIRKVTNGQSDLLIIDVDTFPDGYPITIENAATDDHTLEVQTVGSDQFIQHDPLGNTSSSITLNPGEIYEINKQNSGDLIVIDKPEPVVSPEYDHRSINGDFDLTQFDYGNVSLATLSNSIGAPALITYGTPLAPQTLTLQDGENATFVQNAVTGWTTIAQTSAVELASLDVLGNKLHAIFSPSKCQLTDISGNGNDLVDFLTPVTYDADGNLELTGGVRVGIPTNGTGTGIYIYARVKYDSAIDTDSEVAIFNEFGDTYIPLGSNGATSGNTELIRVDGTPNSNIQRINGVQLSGTRGDVYNALNTGQFVTFEVDNLPNNIALRAGDNAQTGQWDFDGLLGDMVILNSAPTETEAQIIRNVLERGIALLSDQKSGAATNTLPSEDTLIELDFNTTSGAPTFVTSINQSWSSFLADYDFIRVEYSQADGVNGNGNFYPAIKGDIPVAEFLEQADGNGLIYVHRTSGTSGSQYLFRNWNEATGSYVLQVNPSANRNDIKFRMYGIRSQQVVVDPLLVPVVDLEETIITPAEKSIAGSAGATWDLAPDYTDWQAVYDEFQYVDFYVVRSSDANNTMSSPHARVPVSTLASLANNYPTSSNHFNIGAGSQVLAGGLMTPTGNTVQFRFLSNATVSAEIYAVGVRAQKTVVDPNLLEATDLEETIIVREVQTVNSSGGTWTLQSSYVDWQAVIDDFEYVDFYQNRTNGINDFGTNHMRVPTIELEFHAQTNPTNDDQFSFGASNQGATNIKVGDISLTGNTLKVTHSNGGSSNMALTVVGVRAQKTVARPEDISVNDQAASGYVDIGNMRMQWGYVTADGLSTVTLPAPFANDQYHTVAGISARTATPADTTAARSSHIGNQTTTSFDMRIVFASSSNQGASTVASAWQAIGLKP